MAGTIFAVSLMIFNGRKMVFGGFLAFFLRASEKNKSTCGQMVKMGTGDFGSGVGGDEPLRETKVIPKSYQSDAKVRLKWRRGNGKFGNWVGNSRGQSRGSSWVGSKPEMATAKVPSSRTSLRLRCTRTTRPSIP